jgi:hypothetical protein
MVSPNELAQQTPQHTLTFPLSFPTDFLMGLEGRSPKHIILAH